MKILLIYPGHSTSTVDVAIGWERALRLCGHNVRGFATHNVLAFYDKALRMWARTSPVFKYAQGPVLYFAARAAVADIIEFTPDVILVVTGLAIHKCFYDAAKRLSVPMAIILTESPYSEKVQVDMCKAIGFDAVFVNEKASLPYYDRATYLPHSYDPVRHYPQVVDDQYKYDVFFLGTMYPERKRLLRQANLDGLRAYVNGPKLQRGEGQIRMAHSGRLPNEELAKFYSGSKVSLNLNRTVMGADGDKLEHVEEAWSLGPRAFEISACGGFQLAQAGRGELEDVFGGAVPRFRTGRQLGDLARYYLAHENERAELALSQREAVLPCSFQHRAEAIVLPVLAGLGPLRPLRS